MAKHNQDIRNEFNEKMQDCATMDEQELLDIANVTIVKVEKDDTYNTKAKLKIFALFTSLFNCAENERMKQHDLELTAKYDQVQRDNEEMKAQIALLMQQAGLTK